MSFLVAKFPKLLVALLAGIFFILGLMKSKNGRYLCIFLIPFQGISFQGVGCSGYWVIAYFMGYYYTKLRLNESIWKHLHYRKHIFRIVFFIIIGLFVCAMKQDRVDLTLDYRVTSIVGPLIKYMLNITAAIMLFILITNETKTDQDILSSIWAFILSLSYVFVTWVGSFVYDLDLPSFLQTTYSGAEGDLYVSYRFAGYTGEYGLQSEYSLLIIAFSVFLVLSSQQRLERKLVLFAAITISVPMAISTGTRAFVVMLFLFSIIFVSLLLFTRRISLRKGVLVIALLSIILVVFYYQIRGSYLLERLAKTEEIRTSTHYAGSRIDRLLNRPYVREFSNVIETAGFFGVGPINIVGVSGNNLCSHSLYYDMYIKFGILGFLIYLIFYFRLLADLFENIKLKEFPRSIMAIILFSLFLSLLAGQYARSYQNQTSFMLTYWFLFAMIACVNRLSATPQK